MPDYDNSILKNLIAYTELGLSLSFVIDRSNYMSFGFS